MKRLPRILLILAITTAAWVLIWNAFTPEHPPTATPSLAPQPAPISEDITRPTVSPDQSIVESPALAAPAPDFGSSALEVPPQPKFERIVAFNEWAQNWVKATPEARQSMEIAGLKLAEERRPEFKALIAHDPQRALEQAVPRVIRQDLPAAIVARLERPVSATGDFHVYRGRPQDSKAAPPTELVLRYFETPKGESYKARVYGPMKAATSKRKVPLRGVALDRELAVADSPVRQLERGERIPSGTVVEANCPVSGETTAVPAPDEPISDETPAVEVGDKVILLCNGTHVQVVDEKYRAAMGQVQASGPGGAGYFFDGYPGTSSEAIGNFRCLYIRITYPDQMRAPNTEDSAYSDMRNVSRYYLEGSYGKLTTTSVVTPLIVLPRTQAWYIAKDSEQDGLGLVHSDARAEARKLGYDSSQFNCTIVRVNGGPRLSGISWGGGDSVWVSWDGMDVLNHECGHSLGLNHANFWQTTDGTAYGAGSNQEYGNSFDVMGGGSGFGAHYNTISKRNLAWLPDGYVHRPGATGLYRLHAYDQPQIEDGKRYGFRVAKDSVRSYYVEYHPALGGNLADSAMLLYSGMGSNAGHLLDTTPGSSGGKSDGGIQIGRTYSDPEADIHFTVLGKNATTPPSLDLMYQRGPFPGNVAPAVNLSATATTITAGGSITFNTNATDANGDTLAYRWDFNDGVASTNTPTFTRVFSSTDQMTVMVTVSDMKGGVTRDSILINVGNHGRQTVTGQITADGEPLAGVKITSDSGKYCYTDSDGTYVLSDLQTGARTLTAALNGYTFSPLFANPLTVVAGTNTANWTATAATTVALTKSADTTEGGSNGSFVLSRSGSTDAALVVRVAPVGGTATRTTDYAFSPDYADDGSFKTFTIPAGQASLAITVTPVNDTAAEGPETISLQLASNPGYLTFGQGVATMTLDDNDTTQPKVSITASGPYAEESTGLTGKFTITRSGPTTSDLNITAAFSGSATNGTDYTASPASFTIPAGQASATITIIPVNDAAAEGPEDCTLTISSSANYLRDSAAQAATINIVDDDLPVINVSVLDGDAAEAGRDTGIFLLTRSGSTASTLKIYYGVSGSALHGTDYQALSGEITFPAGATSVPIVITPYDDDLGESETQSVTLQLAGFNGTYSLGSSYSATLNITDNDDMPVVSVRAGSTTAAEPSTNGSFTIRSTGSATGNITVRYTVSGTAVAGADYTALSGTVTLSANGSNEATVSIPVLDDSDAEDTETVILTLTPDPAYRIYNDGTALTRLRDNESGERIAISAGRDPARQDWPTEAGVSGRFYVARAGTTGALDVNYTIGGTATNGTDYTALAGTVTIPDGASGADVVITPTNDVLVEGTETIILSVAPGAGYAADFPASATLYLIDNETQAITVGFQAASSSTTEAPGANGEYRDINVVLSAVSANTVTVEYTSNGGTAAGDDTDWTYVNAGANNAPIAGGLLTFPPGTTTQTVRIRVRNDGVVEGNETAILDLRNPLNAGLTSSRNRHTLTISDANDPERRVRFLVSASTRTESQSTEPMLMAVLDRAPATGSTVTVNFTVGGTATPGSDFNLTPGTLTFAAGETVKLLPMTILSDAVAESPETIVVTLATPNGAALVEPSVHTITLKESTVPAVTIAPVLAEVPENQGPAQFTVTRTGPGNSLPVTVPYTVGGTAIATTDYNPPSGSIVIPAGSDSATLSIILAEDTAEEPDDTLIVTVSPSAAYDLGTPSEATITILDDDAPPIVTINSPLRNEITIPIGVGLMVRAEGIRSTPQGDVFSPVTWSMVSGPGAATFEPEDVNSTAVTFPAAGVYVLQATSTYGGVNNTANLTVRVGGALTAQIVGSSSAAGSWSESDSAGVAGSGGTLTISGAGTGISSSGTSDGFYFVAAPITGDFDVKCRLTSITNPGGSASCRVGIMARASTAANAPYAMILCRADQAAYFQARATAGTDPYESSTSGQSLPRWVRLVRSGDSFSAFLSADGVTWNQRGSAQSIAAMGPSPLLGIAVTSAVTGTASTAVFDNLNFHLPTNIGPLVNAGPDLSGSAPWTAAGTASDDNRPMPLSVLWRTITGSANFTNPSAASTAVSFPSSGAYRIRLTATDGAITTFDEANANVTSGSPLESWRLQHFGTSANTGLAANEADGDHDGLSNLLEYGLLSPPSQFNALPFTVSSAPGQFVLHFQRDPARADVNLEVISATQIAGTWNPLARSAAGGSFTTLAPGVEKSETGTGPINVTITINSAQAAQFFRIRVETVAQ